MIKQALFSTENISTFEDEVFARAERLCEEFASRRVIANPRSVGDIVQETPAEKMGICFPQGVIADFSGAFARRAMADVVFSDFEGNYFVVDIKTHNRSGQIQIANSNYISVNASITRKMWMLQLCNNLELFYPKEIDKIQKRLAHFAKIRQFWESK